MIVSRYLELLEACLTGEVNQDPPLDPWHAEVDGVVFRPGTFDLGTRRLGRDWPATAPTMIGSYRLRQLRAAVETVVVEDVPGDLIECGVWRGGACIMMAAVLRELCASRRVFAADSFAGLPAPTMPLDKEHGFPPLKVGLTEVVSNFVRYGLADRVVFVPGWFKDTLPSVPGPFAVLRVDADLYESTTSALQLYDRLSPGGFCIVDDYGVLESCRAAVDDYREAQKIREPIFTIDGTGVYWRKKSA